jgi:hypothetical protein
MLLNLYRSKTPVAIFSLPIFVSVLAAPIFFFDLEGVNYFFNWQNDLCAAVYLSPILNYLLTVTIISFTAHQINKAFNANAFYSKDSYFPGLIYVLCLWTFNSIYFTPLLLSHLFVVLALHQLLKIRRQEPAKSIVFAASFFIGISVVMSPLMIIITIFPWICLAIFRPFVWREWVMVFLGMFLPLFYYASTYYLTVGKIELDHTQIMLFKPAANLLLTNIVNWVFFGLVVIGSIIKFLAISRGEVVRFRNMTLVLLNLFWISVLAFLGGGYFYEQFYLAVCIPLSFFIGIQMLYSTKTGFMNTIVIIWLIISGVNNIFPI